MRLFRRLHNLSQNPAHILWMHKEYQRPMRTNARLAQHAFTHRLKLRLRGVNIGHFVTQMMLATLGVLFKERRDAGVPRQRLDQLNLRSIQRAVGAGRIDKANLHPLIRQVERLMNFRRAHDIAIKHDAIGDGRRCNADMIETA